MTESERPQHTNGNAHKSYAPALKAVAQTAADTANQIKRIDEELIDRVRERPLLALGIAVAAGYVIGRVFSRWG